MSANLSIKNVPDELVKQLRRRAAKHHRSLQGELMAIVEDSVLSAAPLTPKELLAEVRRLGLQTPSESAELVRSDRDGH